MTQFERRKFFRLSGAAVIALCVQPRAGAAHISLNSRDPARQAGAAEPLLEQAVAWVGELRQHGQIHLLHPVSRLQREFRIGYNRTCALAHSLAQRGEWTIAFSADGTRYARIHARVAA
ncbi:hypothetical protein [Herbaspirillum sp. SJZ107]|uniref:hypothetical protein n=1 Tax=Herbaspirillum sp. SJZ107 TaxID=2572881 RepID=UPI00114FBF5D|nr:hypothetical protein [Herbaspirillum sp. SJZ107]TQK03457.1 hypothetical protein FBX97_5025 [Herbaspirillum sp. SJZ107]